MVVPRAFPCPTFAVGSVYTRELSGVLIIKTKEIMKLSIVLKHKLLLGVNIIMANVQCAVLI